MKIRSILLYTVLATSTLFAQSGKELFTKHCTSCHTTVVGLNESGGKVTKVYEAPYAKDVVNKLKIEIKTQEKFVSFLKDYINKPDKRKSLYGKKAIKNFGIMPSLKGAMTDSESTKLANYLYNDYGKELKKIKEAKKVSIESSKSEVLFTQYCAGCHATIVGTNESGGEVTNIYDAPYVKDVVSKLKVETETKDEFIAFVKDYIDFPTKRKSIYGKKAIKNFGLMPSLEGVMSDSESTGLANYIYEIYGK